MKGARIKYKSVKALLMADYDVGEPNIHRPDLVDGPFGGREPVIVFHEPVIVLHHHFP